MHSMTAVWSPSVTARVMRRSTHTLQRKLTPEPIATRVSILGARCQRLLKPEMKNF